MIATSRELAPQPAVPIGAAWVAEALQLAGFQVTFLDLCFQRDPVRAVQEAILSFRPEGIALSVRNLDNCDFLSPKTFLPEVRLIVDTIKAHSDARILVGGAGVSIMPLQVLEYLGLDHAVVGEGEQAAPLFFQSRGVREASQVPGVVCREAPRDGDSTPAASFSSDFVTPRMNKWVDSGKYLRLEPVLPVQGKRGCANRCLYCTYRSIEGGAWRIREAGSVADEIAALMRDTGAREFEFVDSIFNQPEGYLEILLEEILRRGLKARFGISSLSPKGLTLQQVQLMERAGVKSAVVTPEAASDVTLAALRKDFGERDVDYAAGILGRSGMRVLWCFLLGGPQEDEATLAKTAGFLNTRLKRKDSAYLTTGIRIYPGTGLRETAIEEGMITADDNLLMPAFYFSPKLTPQRGMEILNEKVRHLSRCILVSDTQKSCNATLRLLGTRIGLPTPFWRYAGYASLFNRRSRSVSQNLAAGPAALE